MSLDIATILISSICSFVASWAALSQRVKSLEQKQQKHDDNGERLIRLETKLDILMQQIKRNTI